MSHAFLLEGPIRKSLQQPYTGPYEIISRDDKTITLNINNKKIKVSIDRVIPAFILANDSLPTSDHIISTNTTTKTTRSGRRVRFPDFFKP